MESSGMLSPEELQKKLYGDFRKNALQRATDAQREKELNYQSPDAAEGVAESARTRAIASSFLQAANAAGTLNGQQADAKPFADSMAAQQAADNQLFERKRSEYARQQALQGDAESDVLRSADAEVTQGRSNADYQRKLVEQARTDADLAEDEKYDSVRSREFQAYAAKLDPNRDWSMIPASKLGKIKPLMDDKYRIEQDAVSRKDKLAQEAAARQDRAAAQAGTREDRALTRDAAALKSKDAANIASQEKAKINPKQTDAISSLDNNIQGLDNLLKRKKNFDTGPVAKARNGFAQTFGVDDSTVSAFRAEMDNSLADYIRAVSGASTTQNEREFLESIRPGMGDNDETFISKLNSMLDRGRQVRTTYLSNLQKSGKNVSAFNVQNEAAPAAAASGPSRTVLKSGSAIPEAD